MKDIKETYKQSLVDIAIELGMSTNTWFNEESPEIISERILEELKKRQREQPTITSSELDCIIQTTLASNKGYKGDGDKFDFGIGNGIMRLPDYLLKTFKHNVRIHTFLKSMLD